MPSPVMEEGGATSLVRFPRYCSVLGRLALKDGGAAPLGLRGLTETNCGTVEHGVPGLALQGLFSLCRLAVEEGIQIPQPD